jgi:hypothetical protein
LTRKSWSGKKADAQGAVPQFFPYGKIRRINRKRLIFSGMRMLVSLRGGMGRRL